MFQLLYEIGDAGDSRNTPASVPRLIGLFPVVANAEESRALAESKIRVRELDAVGGGAGVLADSCNGRVSDGWWEVGARVELSVSEYEAAEFSAAAGEYEILSTLEGEVGERECA